MKICIIIGNYYPKISNHLLKGALTALKKKGITKYKKIIVHGAFEIPFVVSKNLKKYDAFVALGCIIKGKTPHFDFISRAIIEALMYLSISFKKPIGNGIITCLNKKQALERSNPHKKNKGGEAAKAAISILKF